jgi:TATA-binding protein-associated factor Taf7
MPQESKKINYADKIAELEQMILERRRELTKALLPGSGCS